MCEIVVSCISNRLQFDDCLQNATEFALQSEQTAALCQCLCPPSSTQGTALAPEIGRYFPWDEKSA
jgi:hypothetical protein